MRGFTPHPKPPARRRLTEVRCMDARRFDFIARGMADSRRSFLRSLAIAAGGSVATVGVVSADSTSSGVGGSTSTSVCPPSRRPTKKVSATAPFPVFIVGGTCAEIDDTINYNLIDAGSDQSGAKTSGSKKAIPVASSTTSIRVLLDDLLAKPHAVVVRAGTSNDELIACGEVGGKLANKTVALGLQERNGSGYAGIASLTSDGDQTTIAIYVAQDLFELVDSWEGQTVVATTDINLRKTPSEDGKVIAVIGEGTVMTVTGPAQGDWLPVTDSASGDSGYVNASYVDLQ
jgi:hypothetical protein